MLPLFLVFYFHFLEERNVINYFPTRKTSNILTITKVSRTLHEVKLKTPNTSIFFFGYLLIASLPV